MKLIVFHKIATRLICKTQAIMGISTVGARAIIINPENKILLVKHTYQPHWYIPGGGVKKGETVKAALLRELREEVGVGVIGEPELFGIYHQIYLGVNDYPVVYIVKNYNIKPVSSPEIEKMAWFDYGDLPEMTSPGTMRRIKEYFFNSPRSDKW